MSVKLIRELIAAWIAKILAQMNKNEEYSEGDGTRTADVVLATADGGTRHSRSSSAPTTHVIYTKTSCYFCSEWLENDSFKVSSIL